MDIEGSWWVAFAGLAVGVAVGFAVRRARLCTFGALEDALVGGDTRRLRVFGLALATAIAGTQALIILAVLRPENTNYVAAALPWFGILLGGLLFGLGMALVGTCTFGSLVRLGGGDLRSLVVLLIFGAVAYATLRGALATTRIALFEAAPLVVSTEAGSDLAGLLGPAMRPWAAAAATVLLAAAALGDRRLRRAPRLLAAGVTLGLAVVAGWLATTYLVDAFADAAPPQSLTFVAPVARALYGLMFDTAGLFEFGIGSVLGVVLGAGLAAAAAREFRWEAFDDAREMKRHLLGAVLMGAGGVLCGGCTIGQGLAAGSLMALSAPLAVAGMAVGARLGIAVLVEGSLLGFAGARVTAARERAAGPLLRIATRPRLIGGGRSAAPGE
jgi:uncharacterized membrane protein YedE/YeeE